MFYGDINYIQWTSSCVNQFVITNNIFLVFFNGLLVSVCDLLTVTMHCMVNGF